MPLPPGLGGPAAWDETAPSAVQEQHAASDAETEKQSSPSSVSNRDPAPEEEAVAAASCKSRPSGTASLQNKRRSLLASMKSRRDSCPLREVIGRPAPPPQDGKVDAVLAGIEAVGTPQRKRQRRSRTDTAAAALPYDEEHADRESLAGSTTAVGNGAPGHESSCAEADVGHDDSGAGGVGAIVSDAADHSKLAVTKKEPRPSVAHSSIVLAQPTYGKKCFVSTGLEFSKRQTRIIEELGGSCGTDWNDDVTHVIADTFRRTTKMMCALCRGASVLTPDFITACQAAGNWVQEEPFILKDEVCEAAFARKRGIPGGYSLIRTLALAREQGPLLQGISVFCFPSVVEKRELPLLVAAAGGTWLTRFPGTPDHESVLLLAERTVSGEREQQRRKLHHVYDVELLREAACTQKIRRSAYRLR